MAAHRQPLAGLGCSGCAQGFGAPGGVGAAAQGCTRCALGEERWRFPGGRRVRAGPIGLIKTSA